MPKASSLKVWQQPHVHLHDEPTCFVVSVGVDTHYVAELIVSGHTDVSKSVGAATSRKELEALAAWGWRALQALLTLAARETGAFRSAGASKTLSVYCIGAYADCGPSRTDRSIHLLCTFESPPADRNVVSPDLTGRIQAELDAYARRHAKWETERSRRDVEHQAMIDRAEPEKREQVRRALNAVIGDLPPTPPTLEEFFDQLPPGKLVALRNRTAERIDRAVTRALLRSIDPIHLPPRDGSYEAIVATANPKRCSGLVTWIPHREKQTPYPEIRAAVERRLPRALRSPRIDGFSPPDVLDSGLEVVSSAPIDLRDATWAERLNEDFDLAADDEMAAAENARTRIQQKGIDAIGWYQPYHAYSEQTWGIYVDARGLDDFACKIASDLRRRSHGLRSHSLAAILAFSLLLEHERFHARVEAAASWMELQALHPKYLRYANGVYEPLKATDDLLEEALAEFWSWSRVAEGAALKSLLDTMSDTQRRDVRAVIEQQFEQSPPGYRAWRKGYDRETWRVLATQLSSGRMSVPAPGIGLPIESALREELPFDFRDAEDVPLRFLGDGRIAAAILAAPKNIGRVRRRDLLRVLTKHFDYRFVKGEGKGSHDKYESSDQRRIFPVPRGKDVSWEVFDSFLKHFKLTAADYQRLCASL